MAFLTRSKGTIALHEKRRNDSSPLYRQLTTTSFNNNNMNSKFSALVFAFIIMSATAFADAPASLTVISTSTSSVYKIYYKTKEVGKVKVSIINSANQLVFSEVLSNVASFVRPYNFSELAEGEYTIVLEDKNGKQVEKVNYTMNRIVSFIKVTEVANDQNKYMLNVANNGSEVVTVKIFSNNALLHKQDVQVTGSFGLIYNLSQVKATTDSKITFEVSTSSGKTEMITF
jgi:hypothetical protein